MAVPVWQSVGTAATTTTLSSITPGLPASVAVGDLLICVAQMNNKSTVLSMSGWNTLWARPFWNSGVYWSVFWRIATGSDPNTVASSVAPGGQTFNAQISRYTGNKTSGTILGRPYIYRNQSSTSVNIHGGAIPIHGNNSLAVVMMLKSGAPTSLSTGYTQRLNNTTQVYSIFDANVTSYGYSPCFTAKYGATVNSMDYLAFEIYSDVPNTRAYPYIAQTQLPSFGSAITSATVFFPTNMTNGNILVVMAQNAGILAGTVPAGWQQHEMVNVNSSFNFAFWWKVIDGTEGASITLSFTVNNPHFAAWEIANASTVSPFGSWRSRQQVTATTAQDCNAAFATTQDNVLAMAWYGTGVEIGLDLANDGATTWRRCGMDQAFAAGFKLTEVPTAGTSLTGFTETAASSAAYNYIQFEIYPTGANTPFIAMAGPSVNGTVATSETLSTPTNIVAGDLLLAIVAAANTQVAWDAAPAGWTLLGQAPNGTDSNAWYYKISDGTEVNVTFSHGATSVNNYGTIWCIRGHDTTTPFGPRLTAPTQGIGQGSTYGDQIRLRRKNSLVLMNNGHVSNNWPLSFGGSTVWSSVWMNNNPGGVMGLCTHNKGKIVQDYSDPFIWNGGTTGQILTGSFGMWFLEVLAAGEPNIIRTTPYVGSVGFGISQGAAGSTSIGVCPLPPHMVSGDILCMLLYFPNGSPPTAVSGTGWNVYPTHTNGLWLAWRPVNGTEEKYNLPGGGISWSGGNGNQPYFRLLPFTIVGADRRSPFLNPPTNNSGTSTTDNVPSITTVRDNNLVLCVGEHQANPTTTALGSFGKMLAQPGNATLSPPFNLHILEYSQAAAGASPADVMNLASSVFWAQMTLEVNHPFGTLGNQAVIIG